MRGIWRLTLLAGLLVAAAARGSGEGHRDWDLLPGSTMTNATVTDLDSPDFNGGRLTVKIAAIIAS